MSIAATHASAPPRRLAAPRLVAALALFAICTALFCGVAGTVLVRQADESHEMGRRNALASAIEDLRGSGSDVGAFDLNMIRWLERTAGLKDLRFETEPPGAEADGAREIHPVLDRQGRIVGWFSWAPDRSMTQIMNRLRPLLAATGLCLIGFAGVALWQVRRAMRALARSEQRAWALAHQDMLTGLPNHRKMLELIDAAMKARAAHEITTLAFIDLDGLDDINGAFGQSMGDALLVAWAARLRDALPQGAAGGRFDGDQFAVVMTGPDAETTETALRALADALARPFWINEKAVQVGNTVGLAHAPLHGQKRDEITRRADLALRAAKRKTRGGMAGFQPAMDVEIEDRRFIERELKRALTEGGLDVHYQPIVTADGARVLGVEALARWQHPVRGAIPPMVFVAVAEQAGLMGQLGAFVLRRALEDSKRWPALTMSVNLSPVQVRDPALVDLIANALADASVAPSRLVLEVTEGVLIDNPDEAKARLDALHGLGVRLALDDFGTGYSSLAYLQRFKFNKLKIDKSFVAPLGRASDSQAMVQAIVALGRALGLTLLAEGVETEEQRVLLRLAGCEEMQGFLFAQAAPREALDRLLAQANPVRAAAS